MTDDTSTGHVVVQIILTLLVALIIQLIVRKSINDLVRRAVRRHRYVNQLEEKKREDTLVHVFRPISRVIIWTIALIVILSDLGVNLAALITGAGVVGVVVGLGAQSALRDYTASVFIILENQFRVGDIVAFELGAGVPSVEGVVEDLTIRVTKLRDLDGNLHFIRNGDVKVITNQTFEYSSVNLNIAVGYEADIDKVERVINEVGEAMSVDERWRSIIIEPIKFLRVESFDDSHINIKALGKVQPGKQWEVGGDFRRRLPREFKKHHIEFANK